MALRNPGQLGVLTFLCRTFESRSHAVRATRAPGVPNANSPWRVPVTRMSSSWRDLLFGFAATTREALPCPIHRSAFFLQLFSVRTSGQ
jgi:hypothetical protein